MKKSLNGKSVGVGVIGCGTRIRMVLEGIRRMGNGFRVESICDPSPSSIRAIQKTFNPSARVFRDYRDVANDPRVDWVYVGSWNCFHRAHATAAMESGKHVFCEKPLATTLEDCLAMKRSHERTGKMFCVGFTLRFSPHYRKIRELVAGGAIGDIVSMEFNETLHFDHGGFIHGDWRRLRANAGPHLLEKCCHDIDLAHWLVGSVPLKVASFGGRNFFVPRNNRLIRKIGPRPNGHRPFGWGPMKSLNPFTAGQDIVDNQVAIMEFANQARASFHTNCSTNIYERRMYLCGTLGTLRADVIKGRIELRSFGYHRKIQSIPSGGSGGHGGGDVLLYREMAAAMHDGVAPASTLEDGLKAAVTCFGIDRAMETGRVVDLTASWKSAGISA
jgi:predicted dehydrogenase